MISAHPSDYRSHWRSVWRKFPLYSNSKENKGIVLKLIEILFNCKQSRFSKLSDNVTHPQIYMWRISADDNISRSIPPSTATACSFVVDMPCHTRLHAMGGRESHLFNLVFNISTWFDALVVPIESTSPPVATSLPPQLTRVQLWLVVLGMSFVEKS